MAHFRSIVLELAHTSLVFSNMCSFVQVMFRHNHFPFLYGGCFVSYCPLGTAKGSEHDDAG